MDIELFKQKLSELIEQSGGGHVGRVVICLTGGPRFERSLDGTFDRREQPVKIHIEIEASSLGEWVHVDRRDQRCR